MHPSSQCHIDLRWKSLTQQISSARPEFIKYISGTKLGVAKPICCNLLFSLFWEWSKHTWLSAKYHIHICWVSPQLSCGDTCQICMWFKGSELYFCKTKIELDANNSMSATTIPILISTGIATITFTLQCWQIIKSQGEKNNIHHLGMWDVQTFIPSSLNMIGWINYNIKQF